MASEHKQRSLALELTGGVRSKYAIFSFPEKKRGEVLRKAACVWVEDLEQMIVNTFEHNDRFAYAKHFTCLYYVLYTLCVCMWL